MLPLISLAASYRITHSSFWQAKPSGAACWTATSASSVSGSSVGLTGFVVNRLVFGGNDRSPACSRQTPPLPAEISAHAAWLCYRFTLSFRDVEDLLAGRGIAVSFQTVSEWAAKFGRKFAHQLRRRSRGQFADKWQLDEMAVTIKGNKYWLWRAVGASGYVRDALLQGRRNRRAALRLMRELLKGQVPPRGLWTPTSGVSAPPRRLN